MFCSQFRMISVKLVIPRFFQLISVNRFLCWNHPIDRYTFLYRQIPCSSAEVVRPKISPLSVSMPSAAQRRLKLQAPRAMGFLEYSTKVCRIIPRLSPRKMAKAAAAELAESSLKPQTVDRLQFRFTGAPSNPKTNGIIYDNWGRPRPRPRRQGQELLAEEEEEDLVR